MPCDDPSHSHRWPTSGTLRLEPCERYCAYCRDPKRAKTGKEWESARHLRKHIEVHTKSGGGFEGVVVQRGKIGRPPRDSVTSNISRKSNTHRTVSASRQYDNFEDEDEDELFGSSSFYTPGAPATSTGRDRGAKKRAQEQIKISAALPLVYEPDPSPSPSLSPDTGLPLPNTEDDNGIIFSDEDSPISKPKASSSGGRKGWESRHDWAINRPRINGRFPSAGQNASLEPHRQSASYDHSPYRAESQPSPVNDAGTRVFVPHRLNGRPQVATAAAERSHRPEASLLPGFYARRVEITKSHTPASSSGRGRGRGRGGRPPNSGIPRFRASDDDEELEDVEPQSPPRPSAEALNRIRQHKERQVREMRAPRHPNAGKKYVSPTKDYSQLWLKEFEVGGG